MSKVIVPIWSPEDAWEALAQALAAAQCPASLSLYGESFGCDTTVPHRTHTNAALKARWVDEVTR